MSADASALRQAISDLIQSAGDEAALDLFNGLDVPVASGETKDTGEVAYLGGGEADGSWEITFSTPQAAWTNEGTPAHIIEGNPWLVFSGADGTTVFVKSPNVVHHPGFAGTHWFDGPDAITDERWSEAVAANLARFAF